MRLVSNTVPKSVRRLLAGAQTALPQSDSAHIRTEAKVALGSGYAAFFPPR